MHICFLCSEYPPVQHGGIGSFTQTLSRALAAGGYSVTVVGLYKQRNSSIEHDHRVKVIRLARTGVRGMGFPINGYRLQQTLSHLHEVEPIDILEGPEASLALVSRSFRARKIIRMHGGHHFFATTLGNSPKPWRSWLEKRSFAYADHLCAVSRFVAETTARLLVLNNRRIEILPNPVNTEVFSPKHDISEEDGLILFVGTVSEKKGVLQLIQAMPDIVKQVPHARLYIVGRDYVDPKTGKSFTEFLRTQIPVALGSRIFFMGAVEHSQLPSLIASATVCVYPSHMEALPIAWLEGMAMGKAIVVSETGPGPEVVEDAISGFLCNPYQPASIADKVITLLTDQTVRRKLGIEARQRAVERFSVDVLVTRNTRFYRHCIEGFNHG